MGVYTELIFGAQLKTETPKEIIDTLLYLTGEGKKPEKLVIDFSSNPLKSSSQYFAVNLPLNKMWLGPTDGDWHISTRSNINQGANISEFLQWIKPWVKYGSGAADIYAIVIHEDGNSMIYSLEDV
jgi:hypothetical protein